MASGKRGQQGGACYRVRSIKFNFAMNFLTTGVSLLFPLVTFPYVTRVLMAETYGDYEFANSTANVFLLFAQLGIGLYGTRECARVRDDQERLALVARELLLVTLVSSSFACVAYVLSVWFVPAFSHRWALMLICGLAIPFNVIGVGWYFSATEQFAYVAIRTLIVRVAVVIGMFIFVRTPDDVLRWAAVSVLANSGAYVVNFAKMKSQLPWKMRRRPALKRHLRPMFGFFLAMASISLYSSFSAMLLGLMSTSAQVGYFAAALKIKNVLIAVMTSLTGVLISRASYYVGNADMFAYNSVITKSVHFAIVAVLYLAGLFTVFSDSLVLVLAGPQFDPAAGPVRVMMLAATAIAFSSITANEILTPLGKERYLTASYFAAGVVGLTLNLALIVPMGALGAAVATAGAELTVLMVQGILIRRAGLISRDVLFGGAWRCLAPVAAALAVAVMLRVWLGGNVVVAVAAGSVGSVVMAVGLILLREPMVYGLYSELLRRPRRS